MFTFAKLAFLSSCALAAVASAAPNVSRQNGFQPPIKGIHIGNATIEFPGGLGACGTIISADELGVGVSLEIFNSFPGADPSDPHNNPICQHNITASFEGKSVTVRVVDSCAGCEEFDLNLTPVPFVDLAGSLSVGLIQGVEWFFDE